MLLALRINVLAKGYSGISLETLQQVMEAFNGKKMFKESPLSGFWGFWGYFFFEFVFGLVWYFFFLTVSLKGVAQWVKLWMLVFQLGSC